MVDIKVNGFSVAWHGCQDRGGSPGSGITGMIID
jgi:hypothetical protein